MKPHVSHCPTVGQLVQLVRSETPGTRAPETICLNRSKQCTDTLCPLTGVTPTVMTLRLERILTRSSPTPADMVDG